VRTFHAKTFSLQYQLHASWTAVKWEICDIDESVLAEYWSLCFNSAAKLVVLADRGSTEPKKQADFVFWNSKHS